MVRWPFSNRKAEELAEFQKERSLEAPKLEKPKRPFRLWSVSVPPGEDVARLQSLVSSARKLESLVKAEGWGEIISCKMFYEANADAMTKSPLVSDRERFRAACEYQTLEGFFQEIGRRIRKGKEAEAELERRVSKK